MKRGQHDFCKPLKLRTSSVAISSKELSEYTFEH